MLLRFCIWKTLFPSLTKPLCQITYWPNLSNHDTNGKIIFRVVYYLMLLRWLWIFKNDLITLSCIVVKRKVHFLEFSAPIGMNNFRIEMRYSLSFALVKLVNAQLSWMKHFLYHLSHNSKSRHNLRSFICIFLLFY